jgi:predicted RNA methylase
MTSAAIKLRASIDEIEADRNRALDLFAQAYDLVNEAARMTFNAARRGTYDLPILAMRGRFHESDRSKFIEEVRQNIDRGVWSHLIEATGLQRLMDRTELERFREALKNDPPPATAENCVATFERLMGDADLIFRRGIANAFSRLDRRFRSHDGFKIGSRVVLSYFADQWGHISSSREDVLADIERTFAILDGKPNPERHAGIAGAVRAARGSGFSARAYAAESDYFRVQVYKNGNAHVWFKRDDLVERVNLLLADYYGASLGVSADAAEVKHAYAMTPAKNFGLFESPEAVVRELLEKAGVHAPTARWTPPQVRVLEPSAGPGRIAAEVARRGHTVYAVEIQPQHARRLFEILPASCSVNCDDFLTLSPDGLGLFDKVVMNPPFDGGRDIDHVTHALQFLKPGGRLVSVMAAGVEFREDRKTADFRAMVARWGGRFYDLPPESFAESGTRVNTCIVVIDTPRG